MSNEKDFWQFRRAPSVKPWEKFVLGVLVTGAIVSVIQFGDWWFRKEHIGHIGLFVLLSTAFWYGLLRLIIIWVNIS